MSASNTEIKVVPKFSSLIIQYINISFSPIFDLGGVGGLYSLQELIFQGYEGPRIFAEQTGLEPDAWKDWKPSGDLRPLINLAQHSSNSLSKIDLKNQGIFPCVQLGMLREAIAKQDPVTVELTLPKDCYDLPVLDAPISSITPSIGNQYTISWEPKDHREAPKYQLQELRYTSSGSERSWLEPRVPEETVIIDTYKTEVDFSRLPKRKGGKYLYRVRACSIDHFLNVCAPWSQSVMHAVGGPKDVPGDEAIANTDDPGLKSCLYDHLAYYVDALLSHKLSKQH